MGLEAWIAEQDALRGSVRLVDDFPQPPRTLGGFDVAYDDEGSVGYGALVLLDAATLAPLDVRTVKQRVSVPYIPGFLAMRELPFLQELWSAAPRKPDVLLVDGSGVLHPRRIGSASHAGVQLRCATIGITKTPFIGQVGAREGDAAPVTERGEVLAHALYGGGEKPIFVSPGHRVSVASALAIARAATRPGQRLPEPIRVADAEANRARGAA